MKWTACLAVWVGAMLLVGEAQAAPKVTPLGHWQRQPAVRSQTLTVINQAHVPAAELAATERAVAIQSRQLHRYWDTPIVRFGAGGWHVYVQGPTRPVELGSHDFGGGMTGDRLRSHVPEAIVAAVSNWQTIFSHETMEMLVDPRGTAHDAGMLREVCDPVSESTYSLAGVAVSDFVTPAWFTGSGGPWDETGMLSAPRSIAVGGGMPG